MTLTEELLTRELVALGPRWSAVGSALHHKGIKGFRRNSRECPIANFVRRLCGGDVGVSTDLDTIAVGEWYDDGDDWGFRPDIVVETPPGVRDFIDVFDRTGAMRFLADRRDAVQV